MEVEAPRVREPQPRPSLLPLALTIAAVFIWVLSQTLLLFTERAQLVDAKAAQDAAMQESANVRAQFEAIATKTVELANQGNANAKTVLEQLARTGVDIGSIAKTPQ